MNTSNLIARFRDAGLALIVSPAPVEAGRGMEAIFQMDIRRRKAHNPRSEYFVVWPGADDNLAVVQDADAGEEQVVLMVRESRRVFFDRVPDAAVRLTRTRSPADLQKALAAREGVAVRDVVVQGDRAFLRRVTADRKRHFLAGRDERQLFMCRLPAPCTTVRAAHEALRATIVPRDERGFDRTVRQGEWFFLTPGREELAELELAITGGRALVRRKVAINSVIRRAGKPHVADELVVLRTLAGELRVYVRGGVRHVDHRTARFDAWRRVVRNREVDELAAPFGGRWID
jgi:hypothetical protein